MGFNGPVGRARRAAGIAIVLGLLAAGCGGGEVAETCDPSSTRDGSGSFPVTIEHKFGSTTIEEEPQRVVTVGFTDHDVVLALGVVPVGLREWYGDYERGVWPWAEELLGDAEPALLSSEDLNFEQIAVLNPDLILGLYSGLEEGDYEKLSQIAPTVAQSGEHLNFGSPWQEMTRTAGRALGRTGESDDLVEQVEARFEAIRADHPEFDGVELAYAGVYGEEKFYVETEGSTRVQILLDLGFEIPGELTALGSDSFYHDLSPERLDLLDQQIVLWEPAELAQLPAVEKNALYQGLAVAREDREVFLTDPVIAGAMAHSSVLSLPVVLEELVPQLAAAVAKVNR
jgi:iron complex transport system substrate-binding protein